MKCQITLSLVLAIFWLLSRPDRSAAQPIEGDELVVGSLSTRAYNALLQTIPLPTAPNQKFCYLVQIAPSVLVEAYVPTAAERQGNFSPFAGLLLDPLTKAPFPGGIIPASRIPAVFAWRI